MMGQGTVRLGILQSNFEASHTLPQVFSAAFLVWVSVHALLRPPRCSMSPSCSQLVCSPLVPPPLTSPASYPVLINSEPSVEACLRQHAVMEGVWIFREKSCFQYGRCQWLATGKGLTPYEVTCGDGHDGLTPRPTAEIKWANAGDSQHEDHSGCAIAVTLLSAFVESKCYKFK